MMRENCECPIGFDCLCGILLFNLHKYNKIWHNALYWTNSIFFQQTLFFFFLTHTIKGKQLERQKFAIFLGNVHQIFDTIKLNKKNHPALFISSAGVHNGKVCSWGECCNLNRNQSVSLWPKASLPSVQFAKGLWMLSSYAGIRQYFICFLSSKVCHCSDKRIGKIWETFILFSSVNSTDIFLNFWYHKIEINNPAQDAISLLCVDLISGSFAMSASYPDVYMHTLFWSHSHAWIECKRIFTRTPYLGLYQCVLHTT